jgi:hypothetical protein
MRHALALLVTLVVALPFAACGPSSGDDGDDSPDAMLPPQPDDDGDGISNTDEGKDAGTDTDGDTTPDYLDDDSDGDGVPDMREAGDADTNTQPWDSDGDGAPDFRDTDADGNGLADGVDGTNDLDGDNLADFQDRDDDGDNIFDDVEIGGDAMAPRDTDGDMLPDYRDIDADADTIKDGHELTSDPDGDMLPAYRDTDADGDCRPDALEAGDADLDTPPVDSDGDGGGDFIDLDSDNDGLKDQLEDVNCNGTLDMGESSTAAPDTDMDGVTDLVEVAAGTDPQDAGDNPQANGDFVFTEPYQMPPSPTQDTLDFSTDITQADVVFAMDTTGSMGGEINNLKSSLQTIITQLADPNVIPNVAIAVSGYDDFPISPYGGSLGGFTDSPFYLLHRVMTVKTQQGKTNIQNAVNALVTHWGNDGPESGWEAVYQIASGAGISAGGANVPAFNPASAPGVIIAGEEGGTIGGAGFRSGSLPIVVLITDAASHNGYNPAYNYSGIPQAATIGSATGALNAMGGKIIGVASADGDTADTKADVQTGVVNTMAMVTPAAWDLPGGGRPPGCAAGQCCTGQNGTGVAPIGPNCPLVFDVDGNGNGLGNTIVQAIKVLTTFVRIDITAVPQDAPGDGVDAVSAFIDKIVANDTAGGPCAGQPNVTAVDTNGDGVKDTFQNVLPGTVVCFDVIPKMNTTVPPTTDPQMFKATIQVIGDGVTNLDTRDVYFLVPPEIPDPPID